MIGLRTKLALAFGGVLGVLLVTSALSARVLSLKEKEMLIAMYAVGMLCFALLIGFIAACDRL
jgi:hypothetical protein